MKSIWLPCVLCFLACENVLGSLQAPINVAVDTQLQLAANPFETIRNTVTTIMAQIPTSGIKLSDDMVMAWLWVLVAFVIVCGCLVISLVVEILKCIISLAYMMIGRKPLVSGPFYPYQHFLLMVFAITYAIQRGLFASVFAVMQVMIGKGLEFFMIDETPEIFAYFLAHGLVWGSDRTEEIRKFADRFLNILPTRESTHSALLSLIKTADSLEIVVARMKTVNTNLKNLSDSAGDYSSAFQDAVENARNTALQQYPGFSNPMDVPNVVNPFEGYSLANPDVNPLDAITSGISGSSSTPSTVVPGTSSTTTAPGTPTPPNPTTPTVPVDTSDFRYP